MSKRNFILIVIILAIIVAVIFGFFYFYQPNNQTGGTTEGTNFLANFLPFGKSKTTTPTNTNTPTDVSGYVPTTEGETQNARLKKISSFPVAGYGVFMKREVYPDRSRGSVQVGEEIKNTKPVVPPTEFAPALRYVNKATGNIYQTFVDRIDERKFSSTVIPRVYEAFFGNKGESVVMRYLKGDNKTIETFCWHSSKKNILGQTQLEQARSLVLFCQKIFLMLVFLPMLRKCSICLMLGKTPWGWFFYWGLIQKPRCSILLFPNGFLLA